MVFGGIPQITTTCNILTTDMWSLGPLSLDTEEGQLVEDTTLAFSMETSVGCMQTDCSVAASADNIQLTVSYENASTPAVHWFTVTSSYTGTVTPSLGTAFRSGLPM